MLQTLRDALKLRGKIEICVNKAKLLKDDSWIQGADFEKMSEELAAFDEPTRHKLDVIKRDQLNWANDAEDGINVDEELDEEEIGQRFTKLQPESRSGRGDRGMRRGRSQGRPEREERPQR